MVRDLGIKVNDPTDIEKAVEAYLVEKIEAFKKAARQKDMRFIFTDPAVVVSIWDAKWEKEGQRTFRCHCPVHVELTCSSAKDEQDRRDKINPLVILVTHILARKRFGLRITDLLPQGFKEVTTEDDFKNSKIIYDLEFATSFTIEIEDGITDGDLLAIMMSYFLSTGEEQPAAQDNVTFKQP